jgi:3-hydroxyisobutyrate dehydrogenase
MGRPMSAGLGAAGLRVAAFEIDPRAREKSASNDGVQAVDTLSDGFDSGFGLRLMLKDMRIATRLARRMGTPARLGEAAVEFWSQAAAALTEGADRTEIAKWLAQRRDRERDTK